MHDQLFKGLLDRFFGDFVRIVLPAEAPKLRLERVKFHKNEHFTDVDDGKRRLLDVVAEVATTRRGAAPVLIHVEIEARARGRTMSYRMWRYAMVLRLRHKRPVLPVVLYVRGGPEGAEDVPVVERLGRRHLASFTYAAFGLSKCQAAEYLGRPEALAPAFAALMRRGELTPARHKFRCMERIARLRIDDAARHLLVNCVETYIQLDGVAQEEYAKLLAAEPSQEVRIMQMTYAEKLEADGIKKGLEQGRQEGRVEGRVEGMRALVRDLLGRRFGPLSSEIEERLLAISSAEELSRLHDRALGAGSLDELGL